MQLLIGHVSPETAYTVSDYPYGFKLRCSIRYWLEYHPKLGVRFVSQTTNPKRGNTWNKPKASTYCRFGGAMYIDDVEHVHWQGLTEYCNVSETLHFRDVFGAGVPEQIKPLLNKWVQAKINYAAKHPGN